MFNEAKSKCELAHEGGQLVSITTEELYRALKKFVQSKIPQVTSPRYNLWTSGIYNVSARSPYYNPIMDGLLET